MGDFSPIKRSRVRYVLMVILDDERHCTHFTFALTILPITDNLEPKKV